MDEKMRLLPLILIMCTSTAQAAIEAIIYTDNNGQDKTKLRADIDLENAKSTEVFVSSGLDTTVTLTVYRNNVQVSQQTSHVIGVDDRKTLNGQDYYANIFTLSSALIEGDYRVTTVTKNLLGETTSTDSVTFENDLTPPTFSSEIQLVRSAYHTTIENIGNTSTTSYLYVDATDNSGINRAVYWTNRDNRIERDVQFNADTNRAIADRSIVASSTLVPEDNYYQLGFDIFDKAGNKATISRYSWFNIRCPNGATIKKEVFNSSSGQWQTYSPGMVIHSNPVKVRYGRLISEFATDGWPIGYANSYITNSDSQYHYYERTFIYPSMYSYFHYFNASGSPCGTYHDRSFTFTPAAGVQVAGKYTNVRYQINNSGLWIDANHSRLNYTHTVTDIEVSVETRDYVQKVVFNSVGTCLVPVGQTSCVISNDASGITYSSGKGYVAHAFYIQTEDDSLRVHQDYHRAYWDFNAPENLSLNFNQQAKSLTSIVYNADDVTDWRQNLWNLSNVDVEAFIDSAWQKLPEANGKYLDAWTHQQDYDVSALSVESNVQFRLISTDSYGNSTTTTHTFFIDNIEPEIAVQYDGNQLPSVINNIEKLLVTIDDNSQPVLTEARLTGSNSSEDVYLAIVDEGNSNYSLQQPKIFPTLNFDDGERYQLHLTALDSFGTAKSRTISFGYTPENLITLENLLLFNVNQTMYLLNNQPFALIRAPELLRLDNGQLATGPQKVVVINRSNSEIPIALKLDDGTSLNVSIGQIAEFTLDLGSAGRPFEIEVYPANNEEGTAEFLLEIPELESLY
ncbi:Ig-like domain-containing protein (plasmid) [Vibrio sp. SS-MA-C1-2]|uniref:Ig-like domain-containing protein n=1 Tax=Vibrio sp. SS-MA-C1-2 TaxID=2908646 RepID=UPI001F3531C5|nr:Ig-like domain-containing protein [Vibrio sp. SS-MA-C1-2]UJF20242.1 Ig-like domain-containing protein [Vibrio sp. SS-MA-C1-2]